MVRIHNHYQAQVDVAGTVAGVTGTVTVAAEPILDKGVAVMEPGTQESKALTADSHP